jgi:hypothetical protein
MQSTEQETRPEESGSSDYLRENSKKGNLPCGARYCFRCHEECGVLVNAYIMRDIANECKRQTNHVLGSARVLC